MTDISQITRQTADGTRQAASSVHLLTTLADELRGSVSAFKLPGTNGHTEELPSSLGGRRMPPVSLSRN
jgi:hypothetical protein